MLLIRYIEKLLSSDCMVKINAIFSNSVEKRVNLMQRSNKPD